MIFKHGKFTMNILHDPQVHVCVNLLKIRKFSRGFYFRETSLAKLKIAILSSLLM